MPAQAIELNPFQQRVLLLPEELDGFLGGGRGGGKSFALALLAVRHMEQYGDRARVLYVRRTYKALADFELLTRELFATIYGTAARYNATDHVWRLPGGGYMELAQLETHADLPKFQGRSFTLLLGDEVGQYPSPDLLDTLRANLRGPKGMPIRVVLAANPGGPGHHWIAKRYVFTGAPWTPFREASSKRDWVYAPSTLEGNTFIDRDQYRDQLESACPTDPELLRAWIDGDWSVIRGAYFASVLDEQRVAIAPWTELPQHRRDMGPTTTISPLFGSASANQRWRPAEWEIYLAHDFGSSAPSVTYIVACSPGGEGPDGRFYPRGSLVLIDELATSKRDRPNEGLGWTVPVLAEEIVAMCTRWNMKAGGVADDAIFAKTGHGAGSIADEFSRAGVNFRPARKADRISGWQTMRRLLQDAGKPDVPGLYVSRSCSYWWETVPYLSRDQKRVEDIDTTGPDHAADATRYGCIRHEPAPTAASGTYSWG